MQDLADAVVETAGQPLTSRVGTIEEVNPIRVNMGGTILDPAVVGCASSYLPRIGDTVVLVGQAVDGAESSGSTWMIVAACVNSGSGEFSHNGIQIMGAVQSNNTGVFVDITGLLFPFTKRRSGSLIHAKMAVSAYANAAAAGGEFSARILDYSSGAAVAVSEMVLASHFWNAALTHLGFAGFNDIPNVPAGSYMVQGRFRLYVGAAFIQFDNNDRLSLFFDEV
jgi:hypothetical protein